MTGVIGVNGAGSGIWANGHTGNQANGHTGKPSRDQAYGTRGGTRQQSAVSSRDIGNILVLRHRLHFLLFETRLCRAKSFCFQVYEAKIEMLEGNAPDVIAISLKANVFTRKYSG